MPLPPADQVMGEGGPLTLHYLVAENLPVEVTLEQATQLFDAPGIVAKIRFISELRKDSNIAGSSGQHTPVQPALIAYYSEADALRAIENLDGNDSLCRSEPLVLEYVGKGDETKIIEDLRQRRLTNSVGHFAMLVGGMEEGSYWMQH